MSPGAIELAGGRAKPPGTWTTDVGRALAFLGAVALVIRFGEEIPITALAAPIVVVAGVVLVLLVIAERRAHRRWSLR
jgi:hypothetical protein